MNPKTSALEIATNAVTVRTAHRLSASGTREVRPDQIAVEEPLEIRVHGDSIAITMRTPGDDTNLALGFLYAEGIVRSIDDVGALSHCGRPGTPEFGNTVDLIAAPGIALDLERVSASRRGTLITSACGVCGRRSISDVLEACRPVESGPTFSVRTVIEGIDQLCERQPAFARTGGLHAAAFLDADGTIVSSAEDVGRHNAVDKATGALVRWRRVGKAAPVLLAVSGRASFEIVQKAARVGVRAIASVSAASSLAIDLAGAMNITLASFVRNGACTIYTNSARIQT